MTVEDHYPEGGLGDAVLASLAMLRDTVVKKLAVNAVPRSGGFRLLLAVPVLVKNRALLSSTLQARPWSCWRCSEYPPRTSLGPVTTSSSSETRGWKHGDQSDHERLPRISLSVRVNDNNHVICFNLSISTFPVTVSSSISYIM